MDRYDWSRLNHLQVGRLAEYWVKMEFTLWGFEVYSSEVDDRGIDFVVRGHSQEFLEVQVKSVRGFSYIFFPKDRFEPRPILFGAIVLLFQGQPPSHFLIPAEAWLSPNELLVDREYEGRKSKPEYGINLSAKNMPLLVQYQFDQVVKRLLTQTSVNHPGT